MSDEVATESGNGCLTKGEILNAEDKTIERIELPEWGEGAHAYVQTLASIERDALEESMTQKEGGVSLHNFRAKLAVKTLCDAEGNRIFDDGEEMLLGRKSSKALGRIFDVATRLNGLSEKDVEELAKN